MKQFQWYSLELHALGFKSLLYWLLALWLCTHDLTSLGFSFVIYKMGRKAISTDMVCNMKAVGQLPAPSFDCSADDGGEDLYWTPEQRPFKDFSPATHRAHEEERQLAAHEGPTSGTMISIWKQQALTSTNHLGWHEDWKEIVCWKNLVLLLADGKWRTWGWCCCCFMSTVETVSQTSPGTDFYSRVLSTELGSKVGDLDWKYIYRRDLMREC